MYMKHSAPAFARPMAAADASHPRTSAPARLWAVDTGGPGARLRAEPSTAARIVGGLPDGARVSDLGPEVTAGGRTWRRVTTPGGGAAWIAADLLVAAGRSTPAGR